MKVAFWRQDSPELEAQRARDVLASLSPEARAAFPITTGGGFDSGDWVNLYPSAVDAPHVSASSAFLGVIAVFTCVSIIAEDIASLPLLTYRKLTDDRRKQVPEHNESSGPQAWQGRLARLLHHTPNPEMTSQELWETVIGHVALWGNAYVNVVRDSSGRPSQLWPLRPDCMELKRDDKRVRVYRYFLPAEGKYVNLAPSQVMHVRTLSLDGVAGVSPISVARGAVAISRQAENYAEKFYKQGGSPAGLLIADPPLRGDITSQKETLGMMREGYSEMVGGLENAHRVGVLSGVKWQQVGMNMEDAQFLQSRKWELADIARLYRIHPYKVGITEPGAVSYASVEQFAIDHVTGTLRPWMVRLEGAINRDLGFPGADASTLLDESIYAEFKADALLRGDTKSRYEAHAIGLDKQFLVVNDVRRMENMEPVEWGDEPIPLPGAAPGAKPVADEPVVPFIPAAVANGKRDALDDLYRMVDDIRNAD